MSSPAGRSRARVAIGGDAHDSGSYWDAVATDWDDDAASDDWRAHSDAVNLAACRRWWPSRPVGRVLKTDLFDEVAGEGLVPALAARSSSVVAIDRSFEAARAGRRRTGAGVVGADVRRLPFADGAFDLIVSNSTLDHFQDVREIARALAEMHRVLAPGGRVILTLDNPDNPVVALRNALPFPALHHLGLVPYYVGATLSAADARILLARVGLTVKAATTVMHCPRALAIATLHMTRWLASPRLVATRRRVAHGVRAPRAVAAAAAHRVLRRAGRRQGARLTRLRLVGSGTFVAAYLLVQLVYPALAWVRPGYGPFTWDMYSGRIERPQFSVAMADGTTRQVGNLLRRGNIVRVLGPQVDVVRFVPPYLCAAWPGATRIDIRFPRAGTHRRGDMPGALTRWLTARRPARAVGLFRIGVGLAALVRGIKTARDLYLLGHDPSVVPARLFDWAPRIDTLPPIAAVTALWMLAAAGLTLGVRARTSAGVLCALSIGLHLVDQNFWGHHVYFMTLTLLLMTMVDTGASLSRRWLADGRPERDVEAWPLWLVQVQLSLAYLFTAVAKLNPAFLLGEVLQPAMALPESWVWLMPWLALVALGAEFFVGVALWVPALRSWAFVVGFGLHGLVPGADGAVRRARRLHAAGVERLRPVRRRRAAVAARRVGRHVRVLPRLGAMAAAARLAPCPPLRRLEPRRGAGRSGRIRRGGQRRDQGARRDTHARRLCRHRGDPRVAAGGLSVGARAHAAACQLARRRGVPARGATATLPVAATVIGVVHA